MVWLALVLCCTASSYAQEPNRLDFPLPVLMDKAWGLGDYRFVVSSGTEIEEDSGDQPTIKFPVHFRWRLAPSLIISGSATQVRFNGGQYTAWGASNSSLGIQYLLAEAGQGRPAVQLKTEVFGPTGGMSTGRWNVAAGFDSSWQRGLWGFHLNGQYAFGDVDKKTIGVSEVDRWRAIGGCDYWMPARNWNLLISLVAAQPIRDKPLEVSLEGGIRMRLSERWTWNFGYGKGVRVHAGPEYLFRTLFDYSF